MRVNSASFYAVYGSRAYVAATPAARGNKRYQDCEWVAFDDDHVYFDGQTWLRENSPDAPRPSV